MSYSQGILRSYLWLAQRIVYVEGENMDAKVSWNHFWKTWHSMEFEVGRNKCKGTVEHFWEEDVRIRKINLEMVFRHYQNWESPEVGKVRNHYYNRSTWKVMRVGMGVVAVGIKWKQRHCDRRIYRTGPWLCLVMRLENQEGRFQQQVDKKWGCQD